MFAVEGAASRLLATSEIEADYEVDGKFDTERDHEFEHVRRSLGASRIRYSMGRNHLFHKSNPMEIGDEAEVTILVLNKLGYKMRVNKGVLDRPTFACSGLHNICIQRIGNDLRIFFRA